MTLLTHLLMRQGRSRCVARIFACPLSLFLGLLTPGVARTEPVGRIPYSERVVLLELYTHTNGSHWKDRDVRIFDAGPSTLHGRYSCVAQTKTG
jgi:hypothetical protein